MARTRRQLQSDQYRFPYHYLVDLEGRRFGAHLGWGLDYAAYMGRALDLLEAHHRGGDILDVGCGDGFLLNHFARGPAFDGAFRALGIDLDERPIRFARAFAPEVEGLEFRCQDVAGLDAGAFSTVTVVEVLEHVPDEALPGLTGHVDRVLAPGGTLILTAPSTNLPFMAKHHRHYTAASLAAHFPGYEVLDRHFLTRRSALYHVLSFLLCRLDIGPGLLRRLLLAAFDRLVREAAESTGSRVILVLRKP